MKRIFAILLALTISFAFFTGCGVAQANLEAVAGKFSQYLDDINFVENLSQEDFVLQVMQCRYEGTSLDNILDEGVRDDVWGYAGYYDGLDGGGFRGDVVLGSRQESRMDDTLVYFQNDYEVTEDEKYANYSNRFYTKVELEGLSLPCGTKFGDSLEKVFELMEIEPDLYSDYMNHGESTLYKDKSSAFVFQNLKFSEDNAPYDMPYILTYTETYEFQDEGREEPTTVDRTVVLGFDNSDTPVLSMLDVKVNEKIVR